MTAQDALRDRAGAIGTRLQALSAKSTRRVARTISEPTITRAWVDNAGDPQRVLWATWDHEHGWYDRRTGDWGYWSHGAGHVPSCWTDDTLAVLHIDLDPFEDDGRWPVQGYDR